MSSAKPPISRLYARYLTSEEKYALKIVPLDDVSSEINLLRILTAFFLKFQQSAPDDLASHMQALRTFTLMCHQLAILVRSIDRAHSPSAEIDRALSEALDNVPFDIPNDEQEPICLKNAVASPGTRMPTNTASMPDISVLPIAGPFPIPP